MRVWTELEIIEAAFSAHGALDGKKPLRIPTGLSVIDAEIGGVSPGQLGVVGAPTSHGKSLFLQNMAHSLSLLGYSVLMVMLEDGSVVSGERAQEKYTGIPVRNLRVSGTSYYNTPMIKRAGDAGESLVKYVFLPFPDVNQLADVFSRVKSVGADVVVVDYLQAIQASSSGSDLRLVYGNLLRWLKQESEKHQIPVYLGSQMRRDVVFSKTDAGVIRPPEPQALSESKAIEEVTEIVILLWRFRGKHFFKLAKNKYTGELLFGQVDKKDGVLETILLNEDVYLSGGYSF